MSDEDAKRSLVPTVPPPPGEEDAYSASTVVGQASAELLALIRTEEDGTIAAKPDGASAAERAAPTGPPREPVVVRSSDAPPSAPARAHAPARRHAAPDEPEPGGGLPPALAIALVFAATAAVLATLVR